MSQLNSGSPTSTCIDPDKYDRLLHELFSCIGDEAGFTHFMKALHRELNLVCTGLAGIQLNPSKGLYGWSEGYPKGFIPLLLKSGLLFKDEAIKTGLSLKPGEITSYANFDSNYQIANNLSPFSKTWVTGLGIADSCILNLPVSSNLRFILILNRHKDHGVFLPEDLNLLTKLKPHIERALYLHDQLHQSQRFSNNMAQSMKHLSHAVAVFSPTIQLIAYSEKFKQLGQHYRVFNIDESTLDIHFNDPEFSTNFFTEISLIAGKEVELGQSYIHYLQTNKLPLRVCLQATLNKNHGVDNILIEIYDPNTSRALTTKDIQHIVKASDSEANVCLDLLNNLDVKQISENRGLSSHTVRSYIKSLLNKNNMSRQVELITKILRVGP
jgi:DNA-binding CsgD family transcriptional regulator